MKEQCPDQKLLQEAQNLPNTDWYLISDMIIEAKRYKVKQELERIRKRKFHAEEAENGNI